MLFLLLVTFFIYKKNSNYRFLLIIVNTIISLIYIIWRITVIPTNSGVFSFVLGIILYFAFRKSYPQKAKVCISGTIAAFVATIIICIFLGICSMLGIVI